MINEAKKIELAQWLLDPDKHQALPDNLIQLEQRLENAGLDIIYRNIELPLVEILGKMHEVGIKLDLEYLKKLDEEIEGELSGSVKKIFKEAGGEFNINSPKQLSEILFGKLKINPAGVPKRKTGAYSTDAETLNKLSKEHAIVDSILKYRELYKLQSTYVRPLQELADKNGRVHTTFVQTAASTGRLSSHEPNLQNIPVVSEWGKRIRQGFIADKGKSFLALDYSQIELRVLAAVSGDESMIDAFKKNWDIHKLTASKVYDVPLEKVTPEMRTVAKTMNFGVIYGMGPQAFSQLSGLPFLEAKRFIDEYFADFKAVKIWQEKTIIEARKTGFVENLNGRKRFLPGINHPNKRFSSEAERAAINMPIQGLAADIIKLAMIRADKLISSKKLGERVRMLLTIHDELIFEVDDKDIKEVESLIKKEMEEAYDLKSVSLKVDSASGKNWAEL
ncbi:MAG: DNA polymerase [bacterium]|nr:DNA polymerase [bacterium]